MFGITRDRDRQSFSIFYSAMGAISQKLMLLLTEVPHTLPEGCAGCVVLVSLRRYHARWVCVRSRCIIPSKVPQIRVSATLCDAALNRDIFAGSLAYWRVPHNDTNSGNYRWRGSDASGLHTGDF